MINPPLGEEVAVYDAPAGALNFGQISVPTTAPVELAGNNKGRLSLTITNSDASNPIFVGDSNGVTATSGHRIPAGASLTLTSWKGPLWAIATGATVTATYLEESR